MDSEEGPSKSMLEEKNGKQNSENMVKMSSLDENKEEFNEDLDLGESSEIGASVETVIDNETGVDKEGGSPSKENYGIEDKEGGSPANGEGIGEKETMPSNLFGSTRNTDPESKSSKSAPAKGFGLKKWRRVRRDLIKDGSSGADPALVLKRRLSLAEPVKARDEHKQKNGGDVEAEIEGEDSVPSMESRIAEVAPHSVTPPALDPELRLLVTGTGFSIGADSENSDERTMKSSTAATATKLRYETMGFGRERNSRTRNYGGRGLGHAAQQRGQRGRGGANDTGKKFRGDQLKIEEENSISSAESGLRRSNATFVRWGSLGSNGRQVESGKFDENSDADQASEEVQSGFHKENGGIEDMPHEDLDGGSLENENMKKDDSCRPQLDLDPFLESIVLLQATQEALENEIQKFEEVRCASSGQSEEIEGSNSPSLDAHLIEFDQKIESLEHKLEEASATVKAKESKVLELEAILNSTQPTKKEKGCSGQQLFTEVCEEKEFELESLLKEKLEAEIEYLIITRTTQSLKVLAEDHMALFQEPKFLVEDRTQMTSKLRDAENKAIVLKRHALELEASCRELLATKEVLKLQNRVCKLSICSFIQLIMLCISFGLVLMQLLPPADGVVPT